MHWSLRIAAVLLLFFVDMWQLGELPFGDACALQQERFDDHFEFAIPALVDLRFHWERKLPDLSKPDNWKVVVVPLQESGGFTEVMTNTCKSRAYLAKLVNRIRMFRPTLIVIDKYYTAHACSDDRINATFEDALTQGVVNTSETDITVNVILGQRTHRQASWYRKESCLVLTPTLPWITPAWAPKANGDGVKLGLTRIGSDPMQIPLRWNVYTTDNEASDCGQTEKTKETAHAPEMFKMPSLALAAVLTTNPTIEDEALQGYGDEFPYTNYVTDPPAIPAEEILPPDQSSPAMTSSNPAMQSRISKRIVVIGDYSDSDSKPTPAGDKFGIQLQANFIESLLDGRLLKPLPWQMDLTVLLLALAALHIINARRKTWQSRLRDSILSLFVFFLFCLGVMVFAGFFPPFRTLFAVVLNPFLLSLCIIGEDAFKKQPDIF